jgi:signal transduction histidine kinase
MKTAMPVQKITHSIQTGSASHSTRPGWIGGIAVYIFFAAVVARTLSWTETDISPLLPFYVAMEAAFLFLFTWTLWWPPHSRKWLHIYFSVQAAIILGLLSLYSHLDFLTILFILLSYQAALVFQGRDLWIWIALSLVLTSGSLMLYKGTLKGLSQAMTPMAGCIIFSAYTIASHDFELARTKSQVMLKELQAKHEKLQGYAGQVEELAAMEERNRLARELHDSVSQTMFGILLNTRSAQIMLKRDPGSLRAQLVHLQTLTLDALSEMRGLINQLRPAESKSRKES